MKKFATLLSSIILAVSIFSAGNVYATSLSVGQSDTDGIKSLVNGKAAIEYGGSLNNSYLDGKQLDYLYCVDLFTVVWSNQTYDYTTVNDSAIIHGAPLRNADHVAYLVSTYGLSGAGGGIQGQALQAAIWHEVNATGVYDLNSKAYGKNSEIVKLYNKFVTEAEAVNTIGNISDLLWINPAKEAGKDDYQGLVTVAPVPEPGTMMLLGFGMLGLAIYGKRRSHKEA